jgi:hypothetical protein
MVLNILALTMPGNSARKKKDANAYKRRNGKSKAATGPMLPKDVYVQPGLHWRCSYCGTAVLPIHFVRLA